MRRIQIALKAITQLGFEPVLLNAMYKLALQSGVYALISKPPEVTSPLSIRQCNLPGKTTFTDVLGEDTQDLISEADEILTGFVRNYRAAPVPIKLDLNNQNTHWSSFESRRVKIPTADIKDVWEPARFGWAMVLARAYFLTRDEKYAQGFWHYFHIFTQSNPAYLGINWTSGQEVAIRLICLIFCWQIFLHSPTTTESHSSILSRVLVEHAERIPATLIYARSQQNNHLLSEAAGLFTAGIFLSDHPKAEHWRKIGKKWFYQAILEQIGDDGEYAQHSSNYHRLMLQLAVWMDFCHRISGEKLPASVSERIALATRWLIDHMHAENGKMQNLGHHDGANFLLLAQDDKHGYKSIAQAASHAFLGKSCLQSGAWDEMSLWLGLMPSPTNIEQYHFSTADEEIKNGELRCFLRAKEYTNRPAHADQLHADIWYAGENIACDCGTYRYTDIPTSPWQNALADTAHHNTIRINSTDQMLRAGRFLWLDYAQAHVTNKNTETLSAYHDGYKRIGFTHHRTLTVRSQQTLLVKDQFVPENLLASSTKFEIFWHFPVDTCLRQDENSIQLHFEKSIVTVSLHTFTSDNTQLQLEWQVIHAGEPIIGSNESQPLLGFHSPTYSQLTPCCTLRAWCSSELPLIIETAFKFENKT